MSDAVEMYEYQPAKLHTKLAIVDDVVHIGSSNFDYRSLYINMEMMLRIEDPGFADAMRAISSASSPTASGSRPSCTSARDLWRRLKWALSSSW
jgi:cardiolipin synthase